MLDVRTANEQSECSGGCTHGRERSSFFPRRTVRASLLWRAVRPIVNILTQGVHASFGVHTDMFPLREVTEKPVGQKTVEAHPEDIVFRLR